MTCHISGSHERFMALASGGGACPAYHPGSPRLTRLGSHEAEPLVMTSDNLSGSFPIPLCSAGLGLEVRVGQSP